jgi:tetratricopeptide (TPR) repeat protein
MTSQPTSPSHHWPATDGPVVSTDPGQSERPLWWLLIILLTFVVYVPSLRGGFLWDDDRHVSTNRNIESVEGLVRSWTRIGPESGGTQQYYPITHTSFWIENQLWGKTPIGYRVTNILLHGISAILLWELLRRLSVPGSYVIALVFAVHPIQVESVAWISERKNTLSLALMLAFAFVYLVYSGVIRSSLGTRFASLLDDKTVDDKSDVGGKARSAAGANSADAIGADLGRHAPWCLALAVALFALALLSKTVSVVAPAILLMVLWWKRSLSLKTAVPLLLLLIPGLAAAALTGYIERRYVGATGQDFDLTVLDRLALAGSVTWFYVKQMLLPLQMAFLYPRWELATWMAAGLAAAGAVAVILFAAQSKIGRGPVVAWLVFLAGIAPAMGFANVFPMRYSWTADHFAYIGSIGLISLVVVAVARLLPPMGQLRGILAAAVIALLGAHTWIHSHNFVSSADLFLDTLTKTPTAWMAHHNYSLEQIRLGTEALRLAEKYEAETARLPDGELKAKVAAGATEARTEFRAKYDRAKQAALTTIELRPNHAGAYHTLALISLSEGDRPGAVAHLRKSTTLWESARDRYPPTYELLAKMLQEDGDIPAAIEAFRGAIAAENPPYTPRSAASRLSLARILIRQNDLAEAERLLAEAVVINYNAERRAIAENRQSPTLAVPLVLLAEVMERQQRDPDALQMMHRAVKLDTTNVDIQISFAILLGKTGNLVAAGNILTEIVEKNPDNQEARAFLDKLKAAARPTTAPTTAPAP